VSYTKYKSARLALGLSKQLKASLNVLTRDISIKNSNRKKPIRLRKSKKKSKKKKKVSKDTKTLERGADIIINFLKLYCIYTIKHKNAINFLYKRN
jgi:hypothetical protein